MDGFPQNEHGTRDLKAVACKPKGALGAIASPSAKNAPPPLSKNVKNVPFCPFLKKLDIGGYMIFSAQIKDRRQLFNSIPIIKEQN